MKKTTRLTALILALMLLLVSLSASATEGTEGIPLEDLDAETYNALVTAASEDDFILSEPCGVSEYCDEVSVLASLATAQERYDYMMSLYSEEATDVTLEGVMLHYYYYKTEHNAEGLICECDFPSLAPEYAPGNNSVHEEGCPWRFENLSLTEQFPVYSALTDEETKAEYMAELDEAGKKMLTRAVEVGRLDAMRLEGAELISVKTGEVIADYDAETGALIDRKTGLTVGYVQADGTVTPATSAANE